MPKRKTKTKTNPDPPHSIQLFNKADWTDMREHMTILPLVMQMKSLKDLTVKELWLCFKNTLTESAQKRIPHKMARKNPPSPIHGPHWNFRNSCAKEIASTAKRKTKEPKI